ncbi:MAG: SIMPL domain-containing protein [Armatimonas sp.]
MSDDEKKPDPACMTVTATHTVTLDADGAELSIMVQGSQFFGGNAALKQARELAVLVVALKEAGLNDKDIQLQNAQLEQGGGFGKSSSALYMLKLICKPAERVGDALAVLSQQKNVILNQTSWTFPDDDEARDSWLAEAARKARRRAERIAATLGVRLEKVQTILLENPGSPVFPAPQSAKSMMGRSRQQADWEELGGLEIHHQKIVTTQIRVEYHLGGFTDSPAESPV